MSSRGNTEPFPGAQELTPCSRPQTYGSRNLLRVGVILQRAILILLLCCFPCCAVLINIEQLLLLIRQDPEVSRLGGLQRTQLWWGAGGRVPR